MTKQIPFSRGSLTPNTFLPLYTAFLAAFHPPPPQEKAAAQKTCRVSDHIARFEQPPMFEGKTFNMFDFFAIINDMGGFANVTSWTNLCRKVNMNPSKSNISTRLREWAEKHHIIPFFDFCMGIDHDFYRDLRADEIAGPIKVWKDGVDEMVLETDDEMWLRLYGLDGGASRKKKPLPAVPIQTPSASTPAAASAPQPSSDLKRHLDDPSAATDPKRFKSDHSHHPTTVALVSTGSTDAPSTLALALLTAEESSILATATRKLAHHDIHANGAKTEGPNCHPASGDVLQSTSEGLLVASVAPRLEALRMDLDALRRHSIVAIAETSGATEKTDGQIMEGEQVTKLREEVNELVHVVRGLVGVVDGLRRRVAHV